MQYLYKQLRTTITNLSAAWFGAIYSNRSSTQHTGTSGWRCRDWRIGESTLALIDSAGLLRNLRDVGKEKAR